MDFDEYQKEIGGISKYQVGLIIAMSVFAFAQSFMAQAAVFISAVPEYWCAVTINDDTTNCNLTEPEIKNLTIPYDEVENKYSSCQRYAYNSSVCNNSCGTACTSTIDRRVAVSCDFGYVYDDTYYGDTTTSEWNLVCDRRYLDTIVQTLFFLGFFIGSALVGPLSDWFGRKIAVFVLTIGYVATCLGSAFTYSYEAYAVMKVLVGTFNISLYIAIFTYASEISTTRWRTEVYGLLFLFGSIGHAVYPGVAYLLRDWRYIQITIAVMPAPLLALYFLIPETPRWLIVKGKFDDARKVLSKYAKSKGTILTDEQWNLLLETEEKKKKSELISNETNLKKVRVWDLFRRPYMRWMCFNVMLSWLTVSMVFYGLVLNGGNLAGDPYLNTALNGLVEIAAVFTMYLADLLGRRPVMVISFIMAGFSCISSMLCDLYAGSDDALLTASTALAIIGKFFATLAFQLIYAVTAEIFPTNARTTGLSLGSMAARVGSMLSPLILEIQNTLPWFTQTVFGTLSIITGLFSLFYPETSEINLMTSLDKSEEYYRENIAILNWFRRRRRHQSDANKKEALKKSAEVNYSFDGTPEVEINEKNSTNNTKMTYL